MRLATTRARRRRSPLMIAFSARGVVRTSTRRCRGDGDGVAHELADAQVLEVEADRPGVEAADLEEVLDEPAEAGDVADEEVEGGLGPLRHLVAPRLHHVDRRRERHQRRAQLVRDVGGEAGVALDALLQRRCHVVERAGEHAEIGIVGGSEPRLEPAAGDRLGGFGGVGDRAHGPPSGEHADEHAESGRDRRGEEQRQRHVGQRLVVLVEVEELEVLGVDALEADADDLVGLAVDLGDHAGVDVLRPSPARASVSGIDCSLSPLLGGDHSPFHCSMKGPAPALSSASVTAAIVALSRPQPAVDEP